MGVNHRRRHILVSEQLLDGPNGVSVFQQKGCKRMAELIMQETKENVKIFLGKASLVCCDLLMCWATYDDADEPLI
jgi:hypothetical protein